MAKIAEETWEVDGKSLPVFIYKERRSNNRISITKRGVHIRIPSRLKISEDTSWRSWAHKWLTAQLSKRPDIAERYNTNKYVDGYEVKTPVKNYVLRLMASERSTSKAKLDGEIMRLDINQDLSDAYRAKTIRTLMSRLIANDQLKRVSQRIHDINDHYFKLTIKDIKIKNNSTNWGSCSSSGNINISIKTLLAPLDVQDYIYVHELSHRLEMNHSPAYWAIVARVMPSYEEHERWIKKNGHLCEL